MPNNANTNRILAPEEMSEERHLRRGAARATPGPGGGARVRHLERMRDQMKDIALYLARGAGVLFCAAVVLEALSASAVANPAGAPVPSPQELEFFESRIRPLLVENCYRCHSNAEGKSKGGLLLDSAWGLQVGGDSGPAIVPGDAGASLLMRAVRRDPQIEAMPPKSALPKSAIDDLEKWIAMGAPDPRPKVEGGAVGENDFDLEARKDWWSLQPLRAAAPPAASGASWSRNPIDRFVLAGLVADGMSPAADATRGSWIRRVTFDLTGLPPEPEDVAAFLSDTSDVAFERVVDRLLASPRFGEHWARHWLDLVRYAETKAFENDYTMPNVYRYRDYVIRAFNNDVPYDQFVLESIAGDLLDEPRTDPDTGINESVLGPGLFYLTDGQHGPPDVRADQARVFDGMIDTVSKAFLAQTIACARCHDHKFDAITTADYYSLYGVLASSRLDHLNINPPSQLDRLQRELSDQKGRVREELAAVLEGELEARGDEILTTLEDSADERGALAGWYFSGRSFGDSARALGEFVPHSEGEAVIRAMVGGGLAAGTLASRYGGSIKSPNFVLDGSPVKVRVKGKNARVTLYVQNYELVGHGPTTGQLTKVVNSDDWQWLQFNTNLWKGETAYLEVLQNGGEFSFISGGQHRPEHVDGAYAVLAEAQYPQAPASRPAAVGGDALAAALRDLPDAWRSGKLSAAQDLVLSKLVGSGIFAPQLGDSSGLKREVERLRELQQKLPKPAYARSLCDGDPIDQGIFVRGSHKNISTAPNPRHFMDALDPAPFTSSGSGRREWALAVSSAENPLTARVMVNRIWHHLFGRGIVASTDDLGVMGDAPSHPGLLDYLAREFIDSGWSMKQLIRAIVLTKTYRMSSDPSDVSLEKDPKNLKLQHMPVRRIGAEAVRDTILATSGELDLTMYGPSIPVNLHETNASRARPRQDGPMDGAGRRSIYLEMRRNFLPGLLVAFDMPNASQTFGRRNITNVPAQSLALLNDPFVHGQAAAWAKRILGEGGSDFDARLRSMYLRAFAREPKPGEVEQAKDLFSDLASSHGADLASASMNLAVWTDFCHTMLNRKELIYVY
ncbi:MAG: PSD1 and planctomycete cytochrome C domain-containing protein [Verrucomicrobiales bacterium]